MYMYLKVTIYSSALLMLVILRKLLIFSIAKINCVPKNVIL